MKYEPFLQQIVQWKGFFGIFITDDFRIMYWIKKIAFLKFEFEGKKLTKSISLLGEIKNYFTFLKSSMNNDAINVPTVTKVSKKQYEDKLDKTIYWQFFDKGDGHYLIARVLFLSNIFEYSMFCGSQCIENYLKGYVKFRCGNILNIHDLEELLTECKRVALTTDVFINSDELLIVARKFNPYNEFARYPVHHTHPGNAYAFETPDDIYILDYFVYKMRSIVPKPNEFGDLFSKRNNSLSITLDDIPNFKDLFVANNINFSLDKTTDLQRKGYVTTKISL